MDRHVPRLWAPSSQRRNPSSFSSLPACAGRQSTSSVFDVITSGSATIHVNIFYMKLIIRISITALALLIVSKLPIGIEIDGLYSALVASVILGLLNAIVRPILIILTFPITIVTLGLFIFVINALLFYYTATFVDGFYVSGFLSALIGSIIVSIISTFGNKFIK